MRKSLVLLLTSILVLFSMAVMAGDLNGDQILDKVDQVLNAKTRDSKIEMTIVNSSGQQRQQTIRLMSRGEEKGLVRFLAPADVEGTGFLTRKEGKEDKMWLYLPAIGNVRKIASHNKNGSFMGTDFTYEDISMLGGSNYQSNYNSELLGTEQVSDQECYLLTSIPTDKEIEYSKMKMWVRKTDFMPVKLEFYDKDEKLVKVMTNTDIKKIKGHLTPQVITMKNVQEGTKTILKLKDIQYNVDLPEKIFTTRYLQRG